MCMAFVLYFVNICCVATRMILFFFSLVRSLSHSKRLSLLIDCLVMFWHLVFHCRPPKWWIFVCVCVYIIHMSLVDNSNAIMVTITISQSVNNRINILYNYKSARMSVSKASKQANRTISTIHVENVFSLASVTATVAARQQALYSILLYTLLYNCTVQCIYMRTQME